MNTSQRTITEEVFRGWQAIVIRHGDLTLSLVPEVGGRLMGINLSGNEICFANPLLTGKTFTGDESKWPALCGDWDFPLWGGGKTWVAPEAAWPNAAPHRDLDSTEWSVKETWETTDSLGVELKSPVCSASGLQISRRLSLSLESNEWTIQHTLKNCGSMPISCGIWDVLMLNRPGIVFIPIASDQQMHASAVIALPGKESLDTLMRDGVVYIAADQVQVQCTTTRNFKCGFHSQTGQVVVHFPELEVAYARHSSVDLSESYAHGHPIEVFNAPSLNYFEVETHSPYQRIDPGDSIHYRISERVYSTKK